MIAPVPVRWEEVDLTRLRATEDTIMRVGPDGALISTLRRQWGYMAVLDIPPTDASADEICIRLAVRAGDAAVALTTRGDSVSLYQQSVPVGWYGDLFLSLGLADGTTQAVIRSASAASRPVVVNVESIRILTRT